MDMKVLSLVSLIAQVLVAQVIDPRIPDLRNEPVLQEMMSSLSELQADLNITTGFVEEKSTVSLAGLRGVDDHLIRRMVKFSGAAYCLDLTLKTWLCNHCRSLGNVELIAVESDLLTGGKGYVALDHATKSIVVTFRGSTNIRNWITNFNMERVSFDVGDGTGGISVHAGFLQYAEAIMHKIIPTVRYALQRYNYSVSVTGHSLGGAVATISSVYLKNQLNLPWSRVNLVTFGEPRVGNVEFAKWINRHNPNHVRVVNNRDMVAHLPSLALGYVHRKREIFIRGRSIISCDHLNYEDPGCSLSRKYLLNLWDHALYLGVIFGLTC